MAEIGCFNFWKYVPGKRSFGLGIVKLCPTPGIIKVAGNFARLLFKTKTPPVARRCFRMPRKEGKEKKKWAF